MSALQLERLKYANLDVDIYMTIKRKEKICHHLMS